MLRIPNEVFIVRVSELTLLLLYARESELEIGDFEQICSQNHKLVSTGAADSAH